MARFNSSTAQQGGQQHAPRHGGELDANGWTPEQIARWQQLQAQQHGGYAPPTQPAAHAPPPSMPLPHMAAPQAPHQPPFQGHGYGQPAPVQQPFGHAHAQPQDGWPPPTPYTEPAPQWGAPAPREARYEPAFGDPHAFGHADPRRPAPPHYAEPAPQHHDSQNWDLGNYPPQQPHGYGQEAGYDPAHHGGQWAQPGYGQGAQPGQYGYAGYDANGQPMPAPDEYEYAEHAEGEERGRGPKALIVAGALVGAILLGGGLAYGYKKYSAMTAGNATPVVKADKSPAKTKPATPGGKDVANTDKRFLNSLAEAPPAASSSPPPSGSTPVESDGGPKRVTTMVVGRDGTLSAQSPVAAAPPPPSSGIPGMVIDGGPPRPPLRGPSQEMQPPFTPPPPQAQAPQRIAEVPPPRVRVPEPAVEPAEPTARAVPVVKTPAVKKKVTVRDDAAATPTTTASTPVSAPAHRASSGFVSVLSSRKSREEAFSQYPDLQTKYADILAGKTPDVRETDLTAQGKGVVYRLIVGPPGSKEAAIDTCNKLKAQGYNGCWATPY